MTPKLDLRRYNEAQCFKKKSYFSIFVAQRVVNRAMAKRKVALRIYQCPYCYQYHVTKNL